MRSILSSKPLRREDLAGVRATVMGLGLFGGGRGLTRFLCDSGASVTVTDLRDATTLRPSISDLDDLPIRWVLGEHRQDDFLRADVVFVNPAVPRDAPLLELCRQKGVPLESEMNLFFKLCRGRICAVTGSNGKTTTASLAGAMFREVFPRARLGGNMGVSLLPGVGEISPEDWVILELSSFQLEDLASIQRRPDIALITNLSPNHLDRHGSYEEYLEAKRVVLEASGPDQQAVLLGDDAVLRSWATRTDRRLTFYGRAGQVLPRAPGVWVRDNTVVRPGPAGEIALFRREDLALVGRHNLVNAAGAAAAALAAGCSTEAILKGVQSIRPIEHRLELVREHEGVRYYNDSIATTPESTLCALEALGPDVVLIAGGSDKGVAFTRLGQAVSRRTRAAVLLGRTANAIQAAIRDADEEHPVEIASSLEHAVRRARALALPGGCVILSPACASYDMFTHFAARGELFKRLVHSL